MFMTFLAFQMYSKIPKPTASTFKTTADDNPEGMKLI